MKKYYYLNGQEKLGPFNFEDLTHEDINEKSLVWFEDLEDWTPADEIPELKEIFELIPPPIEIPESSSNLQNDTLYNYTKEIRIPIKNTGNNQKRSLRMFSCPFSFNGRIRRLEYVLSCIICSISYYLIAWIVMLTNSDIIALFGILPLFWFFLAQGSKRSHDIGYSGWFQLIPLYNLFLLFAKSQEITNDYGPNAKM